MFLIITLTVESSHLKSHSDDIVYEIIDKNNDPLLFKIDVARVFCNLKIDPVDATFLAVWVPLCIFNHTFSLF